MEISEFLSKFQNVKETAHKNVWSAQCPCHNDDKKNSLSITYEENAKNIALNDFSGCCIQEILRAVGCDWKDIFHNDKDWEGLGKSRKNEIVAIYDYGEGQRKIRYKNKKMAFQHKDHETEKWKSGKGNDWKECLFVKGSLDNDKVIFVEGEKDAINLHNQLLPDCSTCSTPYGAVVTYPSSKWYEEYEKELEGKSVYILGDYDSTGWKHIRNVSQALYGKAKAVYVLYIENLFPEAKDKWDISDAISVLGVDVAKARLEDAIAKAQPVTTDYVYKDVDNITLSNGRVLDMGTYEISPSGCIVSTIDDEQQTICSHILYLKEIRRDWETGKEKYVLHYEIGKKENENDVIPQGDIVVDPETIFDTRRIVSLSVYGISITSGESAKRIQAYLRNQLDLNRQILPTQFCTSTMGWQSDYKEFIPYGRDIIHDGDERFRSLFEGIKEKGDFEVWKEEALKCRAYSKEVKIYLAASFASPLLAPLECLCSIVHMWSTKSGIGKTVALKLAGSVWGDPDRYCKCFNTTPVGAEVLLSELKNLPSCMDESMLAFDGHGGFRINPYTLCEGVGRTRSNKGLGLNAELTWCNCILTTGEAPLVSNGDGAGAYNRIIDILCKRDLFEQPRHTIHTINRNYGMAGKKFIEALLANNSEILDDLYIQHEAIFQDFLDNDITEKQAVIAAAIVLADKIVCEKILETDDMLTVKDLVPYLKGEEEVDVGVRAYRCMLDWIETYKRNFIDENNVDQVQPQVFYGRICQSDADTKYGTRIVKIVRASFDKMCEENGFSSKSVIEWLDSNGYLRKRADGKVRREVSCRGITSPAIYVEIPWERDTDEQNNREFEPYMNEKEPDDDIRDIDDYKDPDKENDPDITPQGNMENAGNYGDFEVLDDDDTFPDDIFPDNSDFRPLT